MKNYKIYAVGNYLRIEDVAEEKVFSNFLKNVFVDKYNTKRDVYKIFNVVGWDEKLSLKLEQIKKEDGSAYSLTEWETFYTENTGNFNGGGSSPTTSPLVVLVDGASIDLTTTKHTLTSSSAARTFTISYVGDDITLEVILNNTAANYTFPVNSFCVSDGTASGDNVLALAGVSGDRYMISIKNMIDYYYIISKNFGQ